MAEGNSGEEQNHPNVRRKRWVNAVITLLLLLIVIVTGSAAIYSRQQWWEMYMRYMGLTH